MEYADNQVLYKTKNYVVIVNPEEVINPLADRPNYLTINISTKQVELEVSQYPAAVQMTKRLQDFYDQTFAEIGLVEGGENVLEFPKKPN